MVHLAISAFLGLIFAVLFGAVAKSVVASTVVGAGYGVFWWLVGALTLLPAKLGMDLFVIDTMAWRSFFGHIVYGVLLGAAYALIAPRLEQR